MRRQGRRQARSAPRSPVGVTVEGEGFSYVFDRSSGELTSMRADGKELLSNRGELDAWRAPPSNEINSEGGPWREAGLDRLGNQRRRRWPSTNRTTR